MVKSPPKTSFGASLCVLMCSRTLKAHLLWRHQLAEHRARTFAAGVVSRVQDLVVRTSALPAPRRGEAKAAAPAIVDATRVGACGQMSSTGLLSRIETDRDGQTNKQSVWRVFLGTLLLLSVIHADFKDGRPLASQQRDGARGGVQLVNAATAILIPEQEVFIMAEAEGVIQLLALVHSLGQRK